MTAPLPASIRAICRAHFPRCGSCPLRTPCLKWGAVPGVTVEQLVEARGVFVREAGEVVGT